ncbi:MAG: molybdopterin molybdotransferase [Myxococcota bacterium]|jgi:molybdopterin molybdotransferase
MNVTGDYATHEMDSCCQSNSVTLTYAEALKVLATHCQQISPRNEKIALENAARRILANSIFLDRDEPPVARSAMDGFAVLIDDSITCRQIIATNYAGDAGQVHLEAGQAVKVMTGASVPINAEAVVMVEHCQVNGDQLTIDGLPHKSNIRAIGALAHAGALALAAGQTISAGEMATIASCGVSEVDVYCQPRVAIVSTGDEIVAYAGKVLAHQTRDSNRLMLQQQLKDFGAEVVSSVHVADNPQALETAVDTATQLADVVITIGGVSMGDKDYLPQVFQDLSVERLFHKIAIRPGKPIYVGYRQQTLVVGLPGNPVSSYVGAILFVRPIIDAFSGDFQRRCTPQMSVAGAQFKSKARHDFVVAQFAPDSRVVATPSSGSADWRSLATTQVLALVPPNAVIEAGQPIMTLPV